MQMASSSQVSWCVVLQSSHGASCQPCLQAAHQPCAVHARCTTAKQQSALACTRAHTHTQHIRLPATRSAHLDAFHHDAAAAKVRDLLWRPLLNLNLMPRRQVCVERRGRRRDEKRNAMPRRRDGVRKGAYLRTRARAPRRAAASVPAQAALCCAAPAGRQAVGARLQAQTAASSSSVQRPCVWPLAQRTLLAVSPLATTRSAPTTTASTRPAAMSAAAALSTSSVAGRPSCTSSNAVSRAPGRAGGWSAGGRPSCDACMQRSRHGQHHADLAEQPGPPPPRQQPCKPRQPPQQPCRRAPHPGCRAASRTRSSAPACPPRAVRAPRPAPCRSRRSRGCPCCSASAR